MEIPDERRKAFEEINRIPDFTSISNPVKITPHPVSEAELLTYAALRADTPMDAIFPLVVLDTETTGIKITGTEIIEIAAIKYDAPNTPCAKFQTFVRPKKPIPPDATAVNHITDDMVQNAPTINQVIGPFQSFISGCNIAGHNLKFDIRHLLHNGVEFSQTGVRYYDTCALARGHIKGAPNYKLGTLCAYAGIAVAGAHRAVYDCQATYKLFQYMLDTRREKRVDYSTNPTTHRATKFCKYCGSVIDIDCVVCPKCGRQVEVLKTEPAAPPQVVINNTNTNANVNQNIIRGPYVPGRAINKWVSLMLCIFLGFFGAHKFYEGKTGMGILYLFTAGLFGIGWIIDIVSILTKPNPYYVY